MRLRTAWVAVTVAVAAAALVPVALDVASGRRAAALAPNQPLTGMAATPAGGYWLVARDGGLFAFGGAPFGGSLGDTVINQPVVGMATTPSGRGYWMVAADGGVFAFGDASFVGSTGDMPLNAPIVGMAASPSGRGYWLVARDGGVFNFGDAPFLGSAGNLRLNSSVVAMAATPDGDGYRLVAADGGVFTYGDAPFLGSTGHIRINSPVVGIASSATGQGYWMAAADGGIFNFGDAPFLGSAGSIRLNSPVVGVAATAAGDGYWMAAADGGIFNFGAAPFHGSLPAEAGPVSAPPRGAPDFSVATVVGGLEHPWDLGFTPDGTMLFTERPGRIRALLSDGSVRLLDTVGDVFASGEGGLLGLAVDPDFATTRSFVACYGWTDGSVRDVRVGRWTVDADYRTATRGQVLVSGIPNRSGRHTGCRPRYGPDGRLWIGTGDAVAGSTPQDLASLGGKVLRVEPAMGAAAAANPFGTAVYSYGHRNVQGLAFRPATGDLFVAEHGTSRDDEVNLIRAGRNYGWDPSTASGGYNEGAPMTDTARFPDAVQARWSSGSPPVAPSGATFLTGTSWGSWNGALVLACLRGAQLRVLHLDGGGSVTGQAAALTNQGRLRTPVQGPDGSLYVTTSNGGGSDRILRLTPRG